MELELITIHSNSNHPLKYSQQAIKCLISKLEKVKNKIVEHTFSNQKEEIDFFKNVKPKFASQLIFYNDIFSIESNKPVGTNKTIRKYYQSESNKLKVFFEENRDFYKYYRSENEYLDSHYFLRGKYNEKHFLDSFYFQADSRFSTTHDFKLAKIIANEKLVCFLKTEIQKLENNTKTTLAPNPTKKQIWTASKVALIELIYALHAEGVFNNGDVELKEITTLFENAFQIDLGQFNRVFLEIRSRKADKTKFLNTLKEKLLVRMEHADEIE